jgi:hypothetical protein
MIFKFNSHFETSQKTLLYKIILRWNLGRVELNLTNGSIYKLLVEARSEGSNGVSLKLIKCENYLLNLNFTKNMNTFR